VTIINGIFMSTKIYLETPDDIHGKIKRLQFDYLEKGIKKTLRDIYYEVLSLGFQKLEDQKKATQN
jgi:hypothetical protein